jgi:hypothetical protein
LNKDAIVILNFQGTFNDPDHSAGAKSIYKILLESGFHVKYYESETTNRINGDLIFFAFQTEYDLRNLITQLRYFNYVSFRFHYNELITEKEVDLSGALVLTDDKPVLELLNKSVIMEWRKNMISEQRQLIEAGMSIY